MLARQQENSMISRRLRIVFALAIALAPIPQAWAQQKSILVASTTSTEDSGWFGYMLPLFKQKTGIDVRAVGLGTGQAIDAARRGNVDVLFVHAREAEEKFIREGFGVRRYPVMYNDFILVGPDSDPAGVKGARHVGFALKTIKDRQAPFVSRGDRSGTHIAEIDLWKAVGINIEKEAGPWYKSVGQGMGATLNVAAGMGAYALSDRGTWLAFKNKADLVIAVEGDKLLFNQYVAILVNPDRYPHVKKELAQQFIDWLISVEGQKAIAGYKINGEPVFWPQSR
jgi:tungstate transport system substrate-binding protein